MLYSEQKAAQVAAFFLFSAKDQVEVLKLMKLMYLAERESYRRYGEPMIGDQLVSMDHGPVLSRTLNHMNKTILSAEGGWDSWISDRKSYFIGLERQIESPNDLTELSDSDVEILSSVWEQFGKYGSFELADLTHKICPEWEDPDGSATPITKFRLLRTLGYNADDAKELMERFDCQTDIDKIFSK